MFNYQVVYARVEKVLGLNTTLRALADDADDTIVFESIGYCQLGIEIFITDDLRSYCEKKGVDINLIDDIKLSKWIEVYLQKEYYRSKPW